MESRSLLNENEAIAVPIQGLSARGRARLAFTCCTALFLYALYLGALSVLLPVIGKTFHLGAEVQGRLFPATFTGFVVSVLICGYLSDLWGRKIVLLSGIAVYAVGLTLFSNAPTFSLALLASLLVGAGSGIMEAVASALASELYPERRAFIINLTQVAFGVGAALSPTLAHRLLTAGTDWRFLYLLLAGMNVVLWVLLLFQPLPRLTEAKEGLDMGALRRLFRQPAIGMLCLAQLLYVSAETGYFSWMPTYFENALPGGVPWAGLVVTVFWVAMTAGRFGAGWLVGRMPLLRLALLCSLASGLFTGLTLLWNSPLIVIVLVGCVGFSYSSIYGFLLSEAGERYPEYAGTVFGCVVAAGGLGGAIGPWSIGALAATSIGWRGALMTVPVMLALTALLCIFIARLPHSPSLGRE